MERRHKKVNGINKKQNQDDRRSDAADGDPINSCRCQNDFC